MSLFDLPIAEPTVLAAGDPDYGTLGNRRLVAVQTIEIGRLQSDVLPLPSGGGLVAVTGRGPVDSNQSGKTTFEAAVDLLCMSHAWQPRSGRTGAHAEGLILSPDGTFRDHRADRAYILGAFRSPAPGTPPLTVICRIERNADERLRFRLLDGIVFAEGDTHAQRIEDAARLWDARHGNQTYSATTYLKAVLGGHPRSAGYVNKRGNLNSPPITLFTSELSKVPPDRIALDLLQLSGLDELITSERARRAEAAAQTGELDKARRSFDEAEQRIQRALDAIERRHRAMTAVERASLARNTWVAVSAADTVRQLQVLAQDRQELSAGEDAVSLRAAVEDARHDFETLSDLDTLTSAADAADAAVEHLQPQWDVAEAAVDGCRQKLTKLDGQIAEVAVLADQASGRTRTAIEADLTAAEVTVGEATEQRGVVRTEHTRAARQLELLKAGGGSQVAQQVRDAGVAVDVLGDVVEVDDDARGLWDTLLHPWRNSLVIPHAQLGRAHELLSGFPGTVLISGPPGDELPDGVAVAPPAAVRFLAALHAGARVDGSVVTVETPAHQVVGGFTQPQTGRAARLAAAQSAVDQARRDLETAERQVEDVQIRAGDLRREVAAAAATERRRELTDARRVVSTTLIDARRELEGLRPRWEEVQRAAAAAADTLARQQERLDAATKLLGSAESAYQVAVEDKLTVMVRSATSLDLPRRLARLAELTDAALPDTIDPLEPDPAAAALVVAAAEQLAADAAATFGMDTVVVAETWRLRSRRELDDALQQLGITVKTDGKRRWAEVPDDVIDTVRIAYQRRIDLIDAAETAGQAESDGGPASRLNESFHRLAQTLVEWLEPLVEQDRVHRTRLETQFTDEQEKLEAQEQTHRAQLAAAETVTASVQNLVEAELDRIGLAFARRVAASDGTAAELRVSRVDPASETQELRWNVTPAWARHPSDPPTAYTDGNPNTAQEKLKAVQLILSGFAPDGPDGRVLLLDELAAGLGEHHFEEVLTTLADTAGREGLTILATIQDTHIDQVVDHASSVLFFRYRSTRELLNDTTSVLAKGPDALLTDLTGTLAAGRAIGWTPVLDDKAAWDGVSALTPDDASVLFADEGPDTRRQLFGPDDG